jgi:hydrogenase expression/formation protein HypC
MYLANLGKILLKEDRAGTLVGGVDFNAVTREVQLDLVAEAELGEDVVVRVGFALSRLDAEDAERKLEILRARGELDEQAAGNGRPVRVRVTALWQFACSLVAKLQT